MNIKRHFIKAASVAMIVAGIHAADTIAAPPLPRYKPNPAATAPACEIPPPAPKGKGTQKMEELEEILSQAVRYHVDVENALDLDKMVQNAANGFFKSLDPHSAYLTPAEYKKMQQGQSGKISGIGATLITDKKTKSVKIADLNENAPAKKGGLEAGDLIIKIDDKATSSMSLDDGVNLIRGESGTPVTLTILREGFQDPFNITILRAEVENIPVRAKRIGNVGLIELSHFSYHKLDANGRIVDNSAMRVRDAILNLKAEIGPENIQGYILRLTNNPGGFVYQAIDIADHFLDAGKSVLIARGRQSAERGNEYNTGISGDITDGKPLIVMVNEGSASASELLSGALQDHGRAIIMGRQTFGKGSVQRVIELSNGGAVKITIQRYYTPDDHPVQNWGIVPTVLYAGTTPKDGADIDKESGKKNTLPDRADENPRQPLYTCAPISENLSPATLAEAFGSKAVIRSDGEIDGELLCALSFLQNSTEWTKIQPYTPALDPTVK